MSDDETDRVMHATEQWPSLDAVMACENCRSLFKSGHACINCGSENVWNLAAFLCREIKEEV